MRNWILALGVVASLGFAGTALADVPPENSAGCMGKVANDACQKDNMSAGSCVTETCSRLDYSMGTPPTTVQYECLLCNGAAPTPSDPPDEDGGCSIPRKPGLETAGALGAWILGAAVMLFARRNRSRNRPS
ncbi:MAG TPA: hypothetical protein PKA58_02600 [Polyangium sp.]|jgi:hypothetical protein|nr:hypothetical protein [Polyangium sp.]